MSLEAVIFDMDGLLIDSEPLWQEAEKHVFKKVGITLSTADCIKTMGRRVDEVVAHWYAAFPWSNIPQQQVAHEIVDEVIRLVKEVGEPKAGVEHIFNFFQSRNIRMALASSSYLRIIEVVVAKLGIREHLEVLHSAEFEDFGKPHPAVYLSTARMLGVNPERCLAFEDSINGVRSASAAGMQCVFIPEPGQVLSGPQPGASIQLSSLCEFSEDRLREILSGMPS